MPNDEIDAIRDRIVSQLAPLQIYLFGSFANGTQSADSDVDLYIVVNDEQTDWYGQTLKAYQAIRPVRKRPVDILVGTQSAFESRKQYASIEREVAQKGVLLYGQSGTHLV